MIRTLAKETINSIGQEVQLKGWINGRRDHGKIMFLDLRDRSGLVQVVSTKELVEPKPEDCVEIVGLVKKRPDSMINPKLVTGTVEVEAKKITIISKSAELPFPIDTDGYDINEEIRSKYRYLDLRRPRMNRNLRLRSEITTFIRNYLTELDFVEIETPILTKTTPEGARDFLVPSRLQKGKFYALPQSPQQYKQLLMVAGLERYFQFARCFRDEDPRKDRAYGEFTQLD
ncbi:OB-fold nucleic acid binding domain-containing protein, partial [Patescibacteria group bacterium]|nr:OB-fold nucleic acid binding domain-containing protein [Patescibacteria group bacterium]